jgi:hypothetical protein
MGVYSPNSGRCALCGTPGEWPSIGPTHQEGESFDLDLRTGEPSRSFISSWVRCCPNCGYCSLNIFLPVTPAIRQVVASTEYAKQLRDRNFPELANKFLCSALAVSTLRDSAIAGWESLHAAWVCDDARLRDGARECRLKAYAFFEEAMVKTPMLAKMWLVSDLLLCDLLRRTEQFNEVIRIAEIDLLRPWPKYVESILRYQVMLARYHDTECHTFDEALEGTPDVGALKN